jgi:peptidoglycan/LPS O-acetylase OafA/YrhL
MPTAGRVRDPALDGVRALAVTAVLLFHGGVGWLPGGFLGVDAFFVLSGYLITRLLLREWQATRRIDLTAFWARRARRLLPAFGLLVATVVVVSPLVTVPEDLRPIRGDALAALCYLANWRMILRGTDYFTQEGTPSPLRHTWSLSIEEQFYLLWPLVLLLVLVLAHRAPVGRRLVALRCVCVLGALGSVAVGWLLSASATDPNRLYFGTDTRAVALLTGCALAAFLTDRPAVSARHSRTLAAAALGGTLVVAWLWTHADGTGTALYRGPLLLSALAVAAVLAHAGLVPTSVTARLLAAPPLPALGRISYGVYLWHWPLFEWLDSAATGLTGPALLTARVAVTLLAATVSYWAIERPVLRHAPAAGHSARRTLAVALCSLAVLPARSSSCPHRPARCPRSRTSPRGAPPFRRCPFPHRPGQPLSYGAPRGRHRRWTCSATRSPGP